MANEKNMPNQDQHNKEQSSQNPNRQGDRTGSGQQQGGQGGNRSNTPGQQQSDKQRMQDDI